MISTYSQDVSINHPENSKHSASFSRQHAAAFGGQQPFAFFLSPRVESILKGSRFTRVVFTWNARDAIYTLWTPMYSYLLQNTTWQGMECSKLRKNHWYSTILLLGKAGRKWFSIDRKLNDWEIDSRGMHQGYWAIIGPNSAKQSYCELTSQC